MDSLFNIDNLLNEVLKENSLSNLFQNRLDELDLNKTNVQDILGLEYRTLKGILDGTQKMVDVTNLIKIADFLQLPKEQVFKLYVDSIQKKHTINNYPSEKISFIKENFDLVALKSAGLIKSLTDFEQIEKRINARLGYRSIYEYKKPSIDVAFSSGLFKPKNILTRLFWIRASINCLEEINNPNKYDKQALIKFFPQIIWHTQNEERGITEVIKALFKVGITVIYQPPLKGLQLRGATFNVNENPCIVLTNYKGFYSTLWHCLLHELFHVLFDWDDIKNDSYHLSDDDNNELSVQEREKQADDFATKYLISGNKFKDVINRISEENYVKKFAIENHVHRSIVYAAAAYELKTDKAWARVRKFSPTVEVAVKNIDFPWDADTSLDNFIRNKKSVFYN